MSAAELTGGRARHAPRPGSTVFGSLVEIAAGFLILLPLLFVAQINSLGPALSFSATIGYALWHRGRLAEMLGTRWILLLAPAFALGSALWSDYPSLTAKHALELWLTVLGGLLLSASPQPKLALSGVWAAFTGYLIVSFALGHSVDFTSVGDAGDESAFTGLNEGKNLLGMTAALGAILSLFFAINAIERRRFISLAPAVGVFGLELYLVYMTRSAGAVIALALATVAFLTVISLAAIRPRGRVVVCCLLGLGLLIAGTLAYDFANSVLSTTLGVFHKDPTLTGRSYLWYRAGDFIHQRPLLGHGFEAFWVQGNVDAEGLWQYGQVENRSGFNFHNTLIELLVHLGAVGAALFILVYLIGVVHLFRSSVRRPSLVSGVYVGLVVFHLARTPFESLMPSSVDFSTLLLFAALGLGFDRRFAPAPAVGPQRHWRRAAARAAPSRRRHPSSRGTAAPGGGAGAASPVSTGK